MNISYKFKQIILLIGDIFILYFSLYLTLLLRYLAWPREEVWQSHLTTFTIVFFGWVIIFYISGLYSLHLVSNKKKFFETTWKSIIISSFISIIYFYTNQTINSNITPKTNLVIYIVVFSLLFFSWRLFYNILLEKYLPKNYISFIGFNKLVEEIINDLKIKPHLGYKAVSIVDEKFDDNNILNIPVINSITEFEKLVNQKKLNTIVLSVDPNQSNELRNFLFNSLSLGINYISLTNFYENISGKIPIDNISQMWFLDLRAVDKRWFEIIKRDYDIILALIIFIIALPFSLLIAMIIKLESQGPIFFIQNRVGKNNKIFSIIKFRTMTIDGNNHLPTEKNDKRITKFGNFLRKTRIDEIPQVLNIIKGDMSFVGPRPERPELVAELEKQIPFYRERTLVKPGVTGSDQISGEYHSPSYEDSLKKLQYDLFYIKNRSIYLDLSIILKTIATIISREGM